MVEKHSVEFVDKDESQKIEFFDGDAHLGHYDLKFDFNDKKFFSVADDGNANIRVHSQTDISNLWIFIEDPDLRPIQLKCLAETSRYKFWEIKVKFNSKITKISFGATTKNNLNIYFGTSGICNFISPSEKWVYDKEKFLEHTVPDWVYGGVMYQIFPERFNYSNSDEVFESKVEWGSKPKRLEFQGGDLYGIIDKLDYIQNLNVNILYLNPIFLSSSTHRYDTWDHFKVDPKLGGEKALKKLVDELHLRNMKIIFDTSLNHVHPKHFAFQDLIKKGEKSSYKDWFTVYEYPVHLKYRPHLYKNTYKVGWDGNEKEYKEYLEKTFSETEIPIHNMSDEGPIVEPSYKSWWGVPDMPKINYSCEDARKWALDVTEYWINNFDIDGWRMDVAKEIDLLFWKDFRKIAKKNKKNILLFSEIFGDTSQWLQGDMFDGTMNYSFRESMVDYFATKRMNVEEFSDSIANLYFMYSFKALSSCQNLLSSHDVKRFLNRCTEVSSIYGPIFMQATFPGIAGIYYGDEIGLSGGDEPNNREAFPWEDETSWNLEIQEYIKEIMFLKTTNEILKFGNFELLENVNDAIIFRRSFNGKSLLCIFNRSKKQRNIKISSNANNIDLIFGDSDIKLVENKVIISKIEKNSGLIVKEY